MKPLTPRRVRLALAIAMLADVVQLGLLPLFAEGALSPYNNALDVVVAIAMFILVGWHWAFLPSMALELVPALNLVPTWTAAVLFVTLGMRGIPEAGLAAARRVGGAIAAGADRPQPDVQSPAGGAPQGNAERE